MDNIALVPASELIALEYWQKRARNLSARNNLIVVPSGHLHDLRPVLGSTVDESPVNPTNLFRANTNIQP